jgi:hypothetical protein
MNFGLILQLKEKYPLNLKACVIHHLFDERKSLFEDLSNTNDSIIVEELTKRIINNTKKINEYIG